MKYQEVGVDISYEQEKLLKTALKNKMKKIIVNISLNPQSPKKILLNKRQIKILKSKNTPFPVTLNKTQMKTNKEFSGGFIFSLAAAILGAVATGVVSGLVEKSVAGSGIRKKTENKMKTEKKTSGLYLRRNGYTSKISISGKGLFLNPSKRVLPVQKDGIYLFKGNHVYQPTKYHEKLHILK